MIPMLMITTQKHGASRSITPLTTTPTPKVVEEMCIAAAELKKGGDNSEDENIEGSMEESSSEDSNDGAVEEDWADEDKEKPTIGQAKHKQKIFLSVNNGPTRRLKDSGSNPV